MKVLGTAVQLAAATTKLDTAAAVHIGNTADSVLAVTIRNAADDADVGSIYVAAKGQIQITLGNGLGIRGATTFYATPIALSGI